MAIRTGKAMFSRQRSMSLEEAYAYAGNVMACNMMAEDAAEGIDAFIEKRKPRVEGALPPPREGRGSFCAWSV